MIPNLTQLQTWFPLGPVELDAEARREINAIISVRDLFVTAVRRANDEMSMVKISERVKEEIAAMQRPGEGDVTISQGWYEQLKFKACADLMEAEGSTSPGFDTFAFANASAMGEVTLTNMRNRLPVIESLPFVLAAAGSGDSNINLGLGVAQCSMHAITHALVRDAITRCLYRRLPDARFPLHDVLELEIDYPDGMSSFRVVIKGYSLSRLPQPAEGTGYKIPDTAEEFLRGHNSNP